jgi:energy-coupling factor transporter ATP-binding protein EcfA2
MKNLFTIIDNNTSYTLGKYINNQIIYDFNNTLEFIEAKGKQLFGDSFKIYKADHPIIYKLMIYTIRDQKSCSSNNINLQKGILLTGPVGCGKTSLMQLMPYITPQFRAYAIFPTRNIVFSFNANGYDTINTYSSKRACCFDDLGAEPTGRHYGHDCNVMAEILISRYELTQPYSREAAKSSWQRPAIHKLNGTESNSIESQKRVVHKVPKNIPNPNALKITHLTSNLNALEIEDRYGERVRSRLREMVNVLAFPANSPDKRT